MKAERIRITGLVQGVGFRPMVWRLAHAIGIQGQVLNDGQGVEIMAWGEQTDLDRFCALLRRECPALGRIDTLERGHLEARPPPGPGFEIVASIAGAVHTGVIADAATCPACRAEIADPADRRYRYAFTNCTHCGPRLSIIRGIPYDRVQTSMAAFLQCPQCAGEYRDPADRRFHAQPNACPICGPQLWLVDATGTAIDPLQHAARDPIALAARLLAEGHIIAIKGIGGFHLTCDASNAAAVASLRQRKRRYAKPLALMAANLATIARYVQLDETTIDLLNSPAAPIVLARRREDGTALADDLAPGQTHLGFMLPYSPLHLLLLTDWDALRPGLPLVMTSGNTTDEPQCIDNHDAAERLATIADYQLLHDREIVNRVDDSVARIDGGVTRLLRRARGYAPLPVDLPSGFEAAPRLLALGAELKNCFCLVRDGKAILSQHLGDLEDARSSDAWEQTLDLYAKLFQHSAQLIVVDMHPNYRPTRYGRQLAQRLQLPCVEVQHHHAHIASVMADNGWPLDAGAVLGIALDGLGFGPDGTLWGGEVLLADYRSASRLAHLQPVPLPGGTRALIEPWRNTWAQLHTHFPESAWRQRWAGLELTQWLAERPLNTLDRMLATATNSPLSSACGRLFDAVAAALDLHRASISHEGQAAIALEALAESAPDEHAAYPFARHDSVISTAGLWQALLDDLAAGHAKARIAARFHNGLIVALAETATQLASRHHLDTVALSGGVMQNRRLFLGLHAALVDRGLRVLSHSQVPTNDGGIALGQAAVGAAHWLQRDTRHEGQ